MERRSEIVHSPSEYLSTDNYARNSYVGTTHEAVRNIDTDTTDQQVKKRAKALGKGTWIALGVCMCITLILTVCNLVIQYRDAEMIRATQVYEQQIADLNLQTTQLMDQITEQYNFEAIKEAAEAEGLYVDESRVRNVGE